MGTQTFFQAGCKYYIFISAGDFYHGGWCRVTRIWSQLLGVSQGLQLKATSWLQIYKSRFGLLCV